MKRVLGIDCSSTTIGLGVLEIDDNNSIKYISMNYIKPLKDGTIIERIVDTRNKIKEIIEKEKPDYIGIEEIVQFMAGKSTAKTIIMLTTFNRMVCLLAYDYLNKNPELFNVMSIRHGLKLNKVFPAKEDIPDLVAHHLNIDFPWELIEKGKTKGNKKVENFDKADGIAVALHYAFILTGKTKSKVKKSVEKKKKVTSKKK